VRLHDEHEAFLIRVLESFLVEFAESPRYFSKKRHAGNCGAKIPVNESVLRVMGIV